MTTSPGEPETGQQSEETAGYIDDSQLPEDLRPDAEGLTSEDRVGGGSDGDNAAEPMGEAPEPKGQPAQVPPPETTDGESGVSEPTG